MLFAETFPQQKLANRSKFQNLSSVKMSEVTFWLFSAQHRTFYDPRECKHHNNEIVTLQFVDEIGIYR